jgi:hypothetical protein
VRIRCLLATLAFALSLGQQPRATVPSAAELRISGNVATALSLSPGDLKSMPRQTLKVVSPHEKKAEVYEGVAVRELLRRAGVPQNDKLRGAAMAL